MYDDAETYDKDSILLRILPNHLSILEIGLEISLMLFRRREIGIEEG